MKKLALLALASIAATQSFAWDNSIEVGVGRSHDPNHTHYYNSAVMLSGDIYPLRHTPYTYWSLNGAMARWYTTTPTHKDLTAAALALALRWYPWMDDLQYTPYFLVSAGPAYISTRQFGYNKQGQGINAAFQVNGGLGVEYNKFDMNLRLTHYSNAHLAKPDHGFTVLYMLSLGYLF